MLIRHSLILLFMFLNSELALYAEDYFLIAVFYEQLHIISIQEHKSFSERQPDTESTSLPY